MYDAKITVATPERQASRLRPAAFHTENWRDSVQCRTDNLVEELVLDIGEANMPSNITATVSESFNGAQPGPYLPRTATHYENERKKVCDRRLDSADARGVLPGSSPVFRSRTARRSIAVPTAERCSRGSEARTCC